MVEPNVNDIKAIPARIATVLERERRKRALAHHQMAAFIRERSGDRLFSVWTYHDVVFQRTPLTIARVGGMAEALGLPIADLLVDDAPDWARRIDLSWLKMRIGVRLEMERSARRLGHGEFADMLGLTARTYRRYVLGEANPDIGRIAALASLVGETPTQFMFSRLH